MRSRGVELCDILGAIALNRIMRLGAIAWSRMMRHIMCDRLEWNYAIYDVRSRGVELCDRPKVLPQLFALEFSRAFSNSATRFSNCRFLVSFRLGKTRDSRSRNLGAIALFLSTHQKFDGRSQRSCREWI
ncbi:MAG: hypothetical protein KME54_16900 [Tolypothrix brevis GSE-NOS-MK-07-07A]|nr:hypothetical protein [Tolypothrix brevis GSE-NOS-MK-07-07A]